MKMNLNSITCLNKGSEEQEQGQEPRPKPQPLDPGMLIGLTLRRA
jgi:hypothetical protein